MSSKFSIGTKIFRWTIVSDRYIKDTTLFFDCECDCGTRKPVAAASLSGSNPRSKSCGCLSREMKLGVIKNPLTVGDKFGRLTVTGDGFVKSESAMYPVRCDCGTEKAVRKSALVSGVTKSCGCLSAELSSARKTNLTHGMSDSPEYRTWRAMKQRCYEPSQDSYESYGGNGVSVCDRWLESFENFLEDMGLKPSEDYSIDRIDNSVGYCKENCRWVDKTTQAFNRRKFKNTSSQYIGVHFDAIKSKPWRVTLKKSGKVVFSGSYSTELEAAQAYDDACFEHYGIRKNFPDTLTE